MQGRAPYDVDAVRAAAADIGRHAGERMTKLFPEDGSREKSYVEEAICTDWEGFASLAGQFETLSQGLVRAADNGLAMPSDSADADAMMGGDADMMGNSDSMVGDSAMLGGGRMPSLDVLAGMPAGDVFAKVGQSCSARHTKFRVERD